MEIKEKLEKNDSTLNKALVPYLRLVHLVDIDIPYKLEVSFNSKFHKLPTFKW